MVAALVAGEWGGGAAGGIPDRALPDPDAIGIHAGLPARRANAGGVAILPDRPGSDPISLPLHVADGCRRDRPALRLRIDGSRRVVGRGAHPAAGDRTVLRSRARLRADYPRAATPKHCGH